MAQEILAVLFAVETMRNRQRSHRAREPHIKKPALFIERALHRRARVRQQSLLHPHDEHVWKLEALATVHGDERHRFAGVLLLSFKLGVERDVVEKLPQPRGGQQRLTAVIHR